MKCQSCSNEATVHLTSIVDGQKTEKHLCSQCAEKQHAIQHQELNLPAILHNLIGQHVGQLTDISAIWPIFRPYLLLFAR